MFGFLNADDLLLPGALEAVAEAFRTHPEADVVSGHGVQIDAEGRPVRSLYSDRWSLRRYLHGRCILVQPATFARRSKVVEAGGFDEANRTSWDGTLWVMLDQVGARFHRINRPLAAFRVHADSITGSGHALARFHADHAALAERVRPGTRFSGLRDKLARVEQIVTDPGIVLRRALARRRVR